MRTLTFCLALAVGTVPAACARACTASSGPETLHLIELYTSEGCDSCPPAERWMSSLTGHRELVGLEFHVDYWNSTGWRDPFSRHAYSMRQREIAARGNHVEIYTPQIWVDGRVWRNWPKQAPKLRVREQVPILKAWIESGDPLSVRVSASTAHGSAPANAGIYVALTENGLSREVRGGENSGKVLHHDEVVRAFAGPIALSGGEVKLDEPATMDAARSSLVAFVQDSRSGKVLQVLRQSLATCKAHP